MRDGLQRYRTQLQLGNTSSRNVYPAEDESPLWVSLSEWELVGDTLHRMRLSDAIIQRGRSTAGKDQKEGMRPVNRIDLPLRRPIARIHQSQITEYQENGMKGDNNADISILLASPSAGLMKAQALQKPLMRMLAQSLQAIASIKRSAGTVDQDNDTAEEALNGQVSEARQYARTMQSEMNWIKIRVEATSAQAIS